MRSQNDKNGEEQKNGRGATKQKTKQLKKRWKINIFKCREKKLKGLCGDGEVRDRKRSKAGREVHTGLGKYAK